MDTFHVSSYVYSYQITISVTFNIHLNLLQIKFFNLQLNWILTSFHFELKKNKKKQNSRLKKKIKCKNKCFINASKHHCLALG